VKIAMTSPIDIAPATRAANAARQARVAIVHRGDVRHSPDAGRKKKGLGGSAQPFEKAQFGQGKPRIFFDCLWLGLAGFGQIWPNLD